MIARLSGLLISVYDDSLIIDVNGVGYKVFISDTTIQNLPPINEPLCLWIETIIRNEQPCLCGFLEEEQAFWFQILTKIQGVGAKVALSILSALTVSELTAAITEQKSHIISKADGVGPKLASRIILELKGKRNLPIQSPSGSLILEETFEPQDEDIVAALLNLGYTKNEAKGAVKKAKEKLPPNSSIEELLKKSLQECALSNGR